MLRLATLLELFLVISAVRISSPEAEDNNSGGDIQGAAGAMHNSPEMFGGGSSIRGNPGRFVVEIRKALVYGG